MLHIERLLLKDEIKNNTDTWYYQTKEIDLVEVLLDDNFIGFESIGEMLFHIQLDIVSDNINQIKYLI